MTGVPSRLRDPWSWVTLLGYALVGVLIVLPLFAIFKTSFVDPETGGVSLGNYRTILGSPYTRGMIWNSLLVSVGGAVGAVALGIPLAFLTTRFRIAGKTLLTTLALLTLLSPPFIGAYAWLMILGEQGFLRQAVVSLGVALPSIKGSALGVIGVYALQYYPFVFLLTAAGLKTVDRSVEEAAESLGASPTARLLTVTLPLVLPSASAGALIAFLLSLANFGTPMILHYDRVLPTLAFDLYTSEVTQRPGLFATVCLILIGCASAGLLAQRWISGRRNVASTLVRRPRVSTLRGAKGAAAHALCYGIVLVGSLPLGVVVVSSFRNVSGPVFRPGFGLQSYRDVLNSVPTAISNSLLFASAAALAIVVVGALLGYVISRRRDLAAQLLDPLLMTPYMVPGIVLGLGFVAAFGKSPLLLTGTASIMILACFVRRLPYAIRANASVLEQIDPNLEEAAVNLGATPSRTFLEVTLPLMGPGLASGAILAWVTSVNELSASIVLYVGDTVTMPIRIYGSALDGAFGPASALSTLLLAATGLCLFALSHLSSGDEAVQL
jgi:iron(III) transport system permease protein